MEYITLLAATSSAANSDSFAVNQPGALATIICTGLAGGEQAKMQILEPVSNTYIAYLPPEGQPVLSASINTLNIRLSNGRFRFAKDATASPVAIVKV